MPTESAPPPASPAQGPSYHPSQLSSIKCSLCGAGGLSSAPSRSNEGVLVLSDPVERICGGCVRAQNTNRREEREVIGLGLAMMGHPEDSDRDREETMRVGSPSPIYAQPLVIHPSTTPSPPPRSFSQSLPKQPTRPWTTAPTPAPPIPEERERTPSPPVRSEEADVPPNPLLDVTKTRIPSIGRGALYPGSVFRGTQTSGRSAYEVEVQLLVSIMQRSAFYVRKAEVDDNAGCQLPRSNPLRLPLHIPPHRRPPTPHNILHWRAYRSQEWVYHRLPIRCDRARRHASLGSI